MNDIKLMPDKYNKNKSGDSGPKLSMENISQLGERLTSKGSLWFGLSIFFLIATVLISLGLWGYKISLVQGEEKLDKRIGEINSQRDLEFESKLTDLKEKIEGARSILGNRVYPSAVFSLIEELTIPGIQFSELSLDIARGQVILMVEANTFDALAKQIVIFEEDERVEDINLTSANLNELGKATSKIDIKLKTNIFYE
ncbi:MAG: hypothetical protein ABH889_00460 [Candidatus Portnoybacteria bacterium]